MTPADPVPPKHERPRRGTGIAFAWAIPMTVLVWWIGFLGYTLINKQASGIIIHLSYDGFDWTMTPKDKEAPP